MNINDMKESKYLKKSDVEPPIKVTITHLNQENLAMQGQPEELKWIINFTAGKPLVLNSTNSQLIANALGSPETDDWKGKDIVLFNDPNVSFGGKLTGGVRARAVKGQEPPRELPKDENADPFSDDIPF